MTRRRITLLSAVFLAALFMGPGPGIWLVSPRPGERSEILGMPVVYVWAVFWCGVLAAVVITAHRTLWRDEEQGS